MVCFNTNYCTSSGVDRMQHRGEAKTASGAEGANEPTQIIVGTGTQFPNVAFIDENDKLTGYDVELVREIDKRLDDYEFEFQTLEFTNLLLSLETNKIDMVAHQMEKIRSARRNICSTKKRIPIGKTKLPFLKMTTPFNPLTI